MQSAQLVHTVQQGSPCPPGWHPYHAGRKERKQQAHEKKTKFKKNYATIHETVLLWEKLRPKTITAEDKQALVTKVLRKVKGQVPQLAQHHSASRVIQFCLKHASPQDRQALFDETRANVVELAKSKYGHHLVQKLINVASKDEVPGGGRWVGCVVSQT